MIPTRPVMERINEANTKLIEAKYMLIEAEKIASSIEEKMYIVEVQKKVQEGIKEILHNFFPKTEFDEQEWFKRRTVKDIEHDQRVQKILDDSARRQAGCIDCCDNRIVQGDEEHCLAGEEMK